MASSNLFSDQLRGRFPWYQGRGDDDVDLTSLLHEKLLLSLKELRGHLLGVSALAGTIFLDIDLDELRSERLYLLASGRTGVEAADDGSETARLKGTKGQSSSLRSERATARPTAAMALRPATPAPMTKTLLGGIYNKTNEPTCVQCRHTGNLTFLENISRNIQTRSGVGLPSGGNLARQESTKVVGRFENGFVAGNIRH